MQVIKNNQLFSELSNEESAEMNGGNAIAGAQVFAAIVNATGPFLTPQEALLVQTATLRVP
jgi:hypothetical protein